ncbi:trypsin-like peptidase domain-containing protein [Kitasatospora sp. NPDC059146]|uniref:trypsin-like peptidase domain-containing protein n=1 Tax=Kitasatospora sp. NPDC059146 TaxID=3346741 RepID=UPI0036B2A597
MTDEDAAWRRREELSRLAATHTVAIDAPGSLGSGFLVAEDTVLTCAHVVQGHLEVTVTAQGRTLVADVGAVFPEPDPAVRVQGFPDLALLHLREPLPLPGVWLGERAPQEGTEVVVHGFSHETLESGPQHDSLRLHVAGGSGRFVRLQGDRVVAGFSGGPVLDLRTGRVCGVLKTSRDDRQEAGGWLVPVDAVRAHFPALAEANDGHHRPGTDWCDLALDRAGRQNRLFGRDGPRPSRRPPTPAQLLTHGAMPFLDRPELADLRRWCDEEPDLLLRLLHAPGGSGKTRLATELCGLMGGAGWIAGVAERKALDRPEWTAGLTAALADGIPVLVVFDHAQARPEDVCALLEHVDRYGPDRMRLRVLLLARADKPLWQALQSGLDDGVLADASVVQLARTVPAPGDASVAATAFRVFAERLGSPRLTPPSTLDARADREGSLLGVLALALDAVLTLRQGRTWSPDGDPLERVCDHEIRIWHSTLTWWDPREPSFAGESGRLLAAGLLLVPTLAPGRQRADLVAVLEQVHAAVLPHRPVPDMLRVSTALWAVYPAEGDQVAPLRPNRIGEVLARRVLSTPESSGHTHAYLTALLSPTRTDPARTVPTRTDPALAGPAQERFEAAKAAVEVLARARGCTDVGRIAAHPAHRALDAVLARAVADRPDVLLPALAANGALLPHAEPLAAVMLTALESCEPPLLTAVEQRLPGYPSSMSPVSVVVLRRLLELPDEEFTEADQLLRLRRLVGYSLRLDDVDPDGTGHGGADPDDTGHDGTGHGGARDTAALTAARQAVGLSRDLVQQTGRHLPEYATALHNLSLLLHHAGRTVPALEQSRSAVAHYEELLADTEPRDRLRQVRLLDTATALSLLAVLRLEDGQVDAAHGEAARSVRLCEAAAPGVRQEATLLSCVEVLAECHRRTGRTAEAVAAGERVVTLLRDLAERHPGRYLARLPDGLHRQALALIGAGRDREAYLAMREAAHLRADLPAGNRQRLAAQRQSLRVLVQLGGEIREFSAETNSWVEQLAAMGDHGERGRPTGGPPDSR